MDAGPRSTDDPPEAGTPNLRTCIVVVLVAVSCAGEVDPNPSVHVDRANPGPAELPGALLAEPVAWTRWTLLAAATLGASAFLVARRRRRDAPPAPAAVVAPVEPAHVRALERLARLKTSDAAFHADAAEILRDYVARRFDLRVRERTSEEIVAAVPAGAARLREVLSECDLAKFARAASSDEDRVRLVEAATAFVRETSA
jgi:hypothetical protein